MIGVPPDRTEELDCGRLTDLLLSLWAARGQPMDIGEPRRRIVDELRRLAGPVYLSTGWATQPFIAAILRDEREAAVAQVNEAILETLQRYLRGSVGNAEFPEEAEQKARALLLRMLPEHERRTFEEEGFFFATGEKTGHVYCLRAERQINIEDKTAGDRLCYVTPDVPLCDQLLAQKLLIEGDEARFLAVARRWPAPGHFGLGRAEWPHAPLGASGARRFDGTRQEFTFTCAASHVDRGEVRLGNWVNVAPFGLGIVTGVSEDAEGHTVVTCASTAPDAEPPPQILTQASRSTPAFDRAAAVRIATPA